LQRGRFDRSDQKKPEFTCCCCLSPRVWDQTSSKASLYDVERSGKPNHEGISIGNSRGSRLPNLLSNLCDVGFGVHRQLTRSWWSQTGSNRRHPACKAGALPAELWPHQRCQPAELVGPGGLEPPTSRLSGVRSNHLSYGPLDHARRPATKPAKTLGPKPGADA
jgi:hypothetical protein